MLAHTIRFAKLERIFNKLSAFVVFKLLSKPLKLLLSQLSNFCQDHSYTSLIIVIALNDLRCFGKHQLCDQQRRVNLRY